MPRVAFARICALAAFVLAQDSLAFHAPTMPLQNRAFSRPRVALPRERLVCATGDNFGDMLGRGDLEGGRDADRNTQIAALKKSFYSLPEPADGIPEEERGQRLAHKTNDVLGVMDDMPLCRWEMVMLPGFNQALNVWQPMYTHMFETLISSDKPWLYVHLQTPGGTKNLMNPDYELVTGSKAPLVGVLMRVVSAERRDDSRLALAVQGLSRVRVLNETQKEPYARATVQLLPDDEIVSSFYPRAKELLRQSTDSANKEEADNWLHTVSHAAAVASEQGWQDFEISPVEGFAGDVQVLSPFNAESGMEGEVAARAAKAEQDAMSEAIDKVQSVMQHPGTAWPGAPVVSALQLSLSGVLGGGQSGITVPSVEAWEDGIQVPDAIKVGELETRVWVEMDALLRNLRRLSQAVPVPSQLLRLLPPPPPDGWPEGFQLEAVAEGLQTGLVGTTSPTEFVRVGAEYGALRRAQKLSYVGCALLGVEQNALLGQGMLEARGTAHRLAMLLQILTDVNGHLTS